MGGANFMKVARIQRLILSAWCVFLSILVAFFVVFYVPVNAAAPLFYDGTVTWAIARRDSVNNSDFNYATHIESIPRLGSIGYITPDLCGIPSNRSINTFDVCPAFISVSSPELSRNGGYLYVAFCIAYATDVSGAYTSTSLTSGNIKVYRYKVGNLANAVESGTQLSYSYYNQGTNANSGYEIDTNFIYNTNDIVVRGDTRYDGSNFPHIARMFTGNSQELEEYGLESTTLYSFADTSLNWKRSHTGLMKIYVPASSSDTDYVIWINLGTAIRGSFKSVRSTSTGITVNGTYSTSECYSTNCLYLLPMACIATSTESYDSVESYLSNIYSSVNDINANVQTLIDYLSSSHSLSAEMESKMAQNDIIYDQLASDADSLNNNIHVDLGTIPNVDVFSDIDTNSSNSFKGLLGSIFNYGKTLQMLLVATFLAVISYVFFGKKK